MRGGRGLAAFMGSGWRLIAAAEVRPEPPETGRGLKGSWVGRERTTLGDGGGWRTDGKTGVLGAPLVRSVDALGAGAGRKGLDAM